MTSLVLAVTQPHLGGIGGDFFALVRDPNGRVYWVDGSGYSPSRLTRELLVSRGYASMPEHGVFSINVPGMIDGLREMWKRWGSIEWRELVGVAASLAEKGFAAMRSLVSAISRLREELSRDPGSRSTYLDNYVAEASLCRFPGLARALEMVAEDPRSFYEGEIAEAVVEYVVSKGGVLELRDLREYRASTGKPLRIEYRGRVVYEMPPSTQGITTLHMLMLVEEHDIGSIKQNSSTRIKLLLEVARKAYAVRDMYVTDPRYMPVSVDNPLSREFLERIKLSFRDTTAPRIAAIQRFSQ